MEFSSLELIKMNLDNHSRKARLEDGASSVSFVDFLSPVTSDPRPSEKTDRPEPVREARADARPVRPEDRDTAPEPERAKTEEKTTTAPEKLSETRSTSDAPEAKDNRAKAAGPAADPADPIEAEPGKSLAETKGNKGGQANLQIETVPTGTGNKFGNSTAAEANPAKMTATEANPTEVISATATAGANAAMNAQPAAAPLQAVLEKMEGIATGKDGTPPPAANVLRSILARDGTKSSMPGMDPGNVANDAQSEQDAADAGAKIQGPFSGAGSQGAQGADGLFQLQPGRNGNGAPAMTPQAMTAQAMAAQANLPAQATNPEPLVADLQATAPSIAATPANETSISGLSPVNAGDVSAAKGTAFAAMNGRAAAPTATPSLTDQVAVHMKQAANDGLDRIRIQLKPVSLGHIDVSMEIAKDGKVMAVISAERTETFELLQRDARALERALQESGLHADSNSLNFQLRDNGNNQTGENQHGNSALGEKTSEGAEMPPLEEYDYAFIGDGIVDIRV